jgi:hypothetical protein
MSGESHPQFPPIPEGALAGQFCVNHIVTQENPAGTDCFVLMYKGRGQVCPYLSAEHAVGGTAFLGITPELGVDGVCRDFDPRQHGQDMDFLLYPR